MKRFILSTVCLLVALVHPVNGQDINRTPVPQPKSATSSGGSRADDELTLGLVQMSFDEMDLRQGGGCQEPVDGLWHLQEQVETPTRSPRRLGVVQPPPRANKAVGKAIEVAVVGIGTVPIDRIVRPADGTWCICDEVRPHGPVTSQSRLLDLVRLRR